MAHYGKYKGIVRDIHDPKMVGRLRLEVPFPLGQGEPNWSTWALPCLPPGHFELPEEGEHVWVEFEQGDLNAPIWVGTFFVGSGAQTTAPWQAPHAVLTDYDGVEVDRDKADHTLSGSVDDREHKEWHNHTTEFYEPHQRGWVSGTGHHLRFNDHPGRDAFVRLADRFGRVLQFFARGVTRLRSYLESDQNATWEDLNGAPIDGYHEVAMADFENDGTLDDAGQWLRVRDMAQAMLLFTSTPGAERVELKDFWGQVLRIHSVKDAEYIELIDKAGQKVKMDPIAGTIRIDDDNGNYILMTNGKITLYVPGGTRVNVGGDAGQQLATKAFVENYFNTHKHSTPSGPSGPPLTQAPLSPGNDITEKTWGE